MSNSGTAVKQLAISAGMLVALALVTALVALFVGISFHDYRVLRQSLAADQHVPQIIDYQREEIGQQRLQIQSFAHEINALKEKLFRLDRFEEKIRVIANLSSSQADDNLFGVGGTAPEDLETPLELTQRHEGLMREMHQQVGELDTASQRKEESFGTLLDKLEDQRNLLASTPAIRPAGGWMTSRFGHRVSPFTGRKELHKGVDIANRKGTAVLAAVNGIVSFVGNSGRSTGPHLHYEVHLNGVPVNPATYILN